ncbi:GNAT family protein [Pantoea ananatis]|uniref:GNAT family N-acetyltransferase n=1 Tax=Pantoea ananas TaxID=553 RepID=UPI0024ADFD0D|nr:GNAT family protein [Pantoea ananatis]MDI6539126.1 GNAT family protein [Pantoea ananatis]
MIRKFKGNRIFFSLPDTDSLPHFARWIQTREHAETMGGISSFTPYNKAYRIAEEWCNQNKDNIPVSITLMIYLNKNQRPVGYIKITSINWIARNAELSCFIDTDFINRGLGADALLTAIRFIFEELNLERFYGKVYNNNINSIKLTESFTNKLGEMKEHCNGSLNLVDLSVYSLSREEYWSKLNSDSSFFNGLKRRYKL